MKRVYRTDNSVLSAAQVFRDNRRLIIQHFTDVYLKFRLLSLLLLVLLPERFGCSIGIVALLEAALLRRLSILCRL